ncbi:hypothetical protein Trydic_g15836 [Trypoxylus dichotomus]
MLDIDPCQTLEELSAALDVDRSTVGKRLHALEIVQKAGNWVPQELKGEGGNTGMFSFAKNFLTDGAHYPDENPKSHDTRSQHPNGARLSELLAGIENSLAIASHVIFFYQLETGRQIIVEKSDLM